MKRILALVLAISCILVVCGCGDNEGRDVSDVSGNPSAGSGENGQSNVTYKTFDDLTRTQRVPNFDIYLDIPLYVETGGHGFVSQTSRDYAIVVACSREARSDISVDDDFADVMNDTYHNLVNSFNDFKCEDYTPDTIDTVTLPCGAEAIKFEGIQPADCWGTPKECYLYGYSLVFNDVLMIVSYIVFKDSAVDDATRAELANYIDEMVQTVRTEA